MLGPLARRIATYKIGAFLLSACGLALAPLVAATAEIPLMAIPGPFLPPPPPVSHFLTNTPLATPLLCEDFF